MDLIRNRASTKKLLLENEDKAKQHSYETELWELRRKIKASARKDKRNWLKGITEKIEKAGNTGNSKKVFEQVKKVAGKQGSLPAGKSVSEIMRRSSGRIVLRAEKF